MSIKCFLNARSTYTLLLWSCIEPEVHAHSDCDHASAQFCQLFLRRASSVFSYPVIHWQTVPLFMFYLWCNLWVSYIGSLLYLLIQHSSLHELFCIAAESAVLLCYDTSWICREYSADQYLFWLFTYLARWKQASSLNRTGVGFVSSSCHWKLNNAV